MLTQQTDTAQHLARSALAIAETLGHQPSMYHSPAIRAVFARVRQLAHLATDAADHLIDTVDILNDTRTGLPIELGDDFLAILTDQQARQEAGRRPDHTPCAEPRTSATGRSGNAQTRRPLTQPSSTGLACRSPRRGEHQPQHPIPLKDLPISPAHLVEFTPALVRRLPGTWSADLRHHHGPDDLVARTGRVWGPSTNRPSLARFSPVTDAVLTGPDGWGLYLLPHHTDRLLVCPLVPDDLHEDYADRTPAPPCIAVPAYPARAAWRLQEQLFPSYTRALHSARRAQFSALSLTPRAPAPPAPASPPGPRRTR
ncbi:hypothetical protein [Streptomyces sp. NPDC002221]|uniref:hypothetical protein n=1 Tax=Streptomyces sp. NPDC002221 TaxID=3364639 RepID=UPI0036C795E5